MGLVLRALIFTAVLLMPKWLVAIRFGRYSPLLWSDWDEPLYLRWTIDVGRNFWHSFGFLTSQSTFSEQHLAYPHLVADYLVGIPAALFFSPLPLGLVLDAVVVPISYLVFTRVFSELTENPRAGEMSAAISLWLPWLMPLTRHVETSFGWDSAFSTAVNISAGSAHVCQPVIRGLYTQISYPILGLSLLWVLRSLGQRENRTRHFVAAGGSAGLLLYAYFFAWASALAVIGSFLLLAWAVRKVTLADLSAWAFGTVVASAPGLWMILRTLRIPASSGGGENAFQWPWHISPEVALLSIVALTFLLIRKGNRLLLALLLAVGIAEHALMNLPASLGLGLEPHHFTQLFLHPLLTGCSIAAVLSCFPFVGLERLLPILFLIHGSAQSYRQLQTAKDLEAEGALLRFLGEETATTASILTVPFAHAFERENSFPDTLLLPFWIQATAERRTNTISQASSRKRMEVAQEQMLGLLYTGTPRLVGGCPEKLSNPSLNTVFSQYERLRKEWCRLASQLTAADREESLPKNAQYMLWDRRWPLPYPPTFPWFGPRLWESADGRYAVFEFRPSLVSED